MSNQYVAVETRGEMTIHLPGATADADTLCGMDAHDDHPSVGNREVSVPRGARVNCPLCYEIWKRARAYSHLEFEIE